MDRLRLRAGEDFLKPRIVSKRVPFPACSQIGKGNAVIRVVDSKRSCKQTLNCKNRSVGFSGAREDQSLKRLRDGALDHVSRDGLQLDCALGFAKSIFFSPHECVKQAELCVACRVLRTVGDRFFQCRSGCFKVCLRARGQTLKQPDRHWKKRSPTVRKTRHATHNSACFTHSWGEKKMLF